MFGVISRWQVPSWKVVLSIVVTAFVVRLMDDFLDRHYDQDGGRLTLAGVLQEGTLPYALIAMGVATYLSPPWALSLFAAAYSIGMTGELGRQYPSGLPGYVESALILSGVLLCFGWRQTVFALLLIGGIQGWDDVMDYWQDRSRGSRNWAVRWGINPVRFFSLGSLLLALAMSPWQALVGLISVPSINWMSQRLAERGGNNDAPPKG
ncbi:MAG: hypothetical protein GX030_10740 [Firmicutes bacterium]|nr:hypothetical protein [Bacillota bacterium]